MKAGTVWIVEEFDQSDATIASGLFTALWEGPDGDREQGPRRVPADQAIAWGRERAEVVHIRAAGGDYHSAGERKSDRYPSPEWPAGHAPARRRLEHYAYLDRTQADDPILWDVEVRVQFRAPDRQAVAHAFNEAISSQPGVIDAAPYEDPSPPVQDLEDLAAESGSAGARFKMSGRTHDEVIAKVDEVARAAMQQVSASCEGEWSLSTDAVPSSPGHG